MNRNSGAEPDGALSARDIRRYTFKASLARTEGGLMDIVSEVYTYVLGALVLIAMSGALVAGLRAQLGIAAIAAAQAGPALLAPESAAAALLLALAAVLLSTELALGPVSMTLPQMSWWLPLPVRRHGFIAPGFYRSLLWPAAAAAAVMLPLSLGLGGSPDPGRAALATVCAVSVSMLLYSLAGWAQATGRGGWLRPAASLVAAAAPLLVMGAALYNSAGGAADLGWLLWLPTGWPLLVAEGNLWPLLLVAAAGAALAWVHARLEQISTASLRAGAMVAGHVGGSILTMDTGELARALGPARESKGSRWITVPMFFRHGPAGGSVRGSLAARARRTLLATHAVLALRQPGRLLRALVLATLPGTLAATLPAVAGASGEPGAATAVLATALLFCAHAAVVSFGSTARFAAGNPSVDALLPLSERSVRRIHWLVPAAGMVLWMGIAFTLLDLLDTGSPALTLLALLAGPGLGAATVRAAFRPAPDWTMPAVATAAGPVPVGAARSFFVGPDLTVITLLPVLLCLLSGGVPWQAYLIQLGLSLLAVLWGTRLRRRVRSTAQ
ncbi:DUF6297 family protein [Arthrobacter sp. 35W]|uniref:DUF6297 family protein n=1 Tax=Arthrobacter sp. 35W TaxID=1132441 RepID=UPI00047E8A1A|nr:DUF6297 family protein [Arthrobacter sp. 35W]